MQIIISDDVKSAITDIFDYSYNISANYASRIVNKIYDTIYDLQDSPYIGRYVPELSEFFLDSFPNHTMVCFLSLLYIQLI